MAIGALTNALPAVFGLSAGFGDLFIGLTAPLAALAWALYRADEFVEARDTMTEALASGVTDAHLFYQAAMIHQACSVNGNADRYLKLAASINPHYRSFHVHR